MILVTVPKEIKRVQCIPNYLHAQLQEPMHPLKNALCPVVCITMKNLGMKAFYILQETKYNSMTGTWVTLQIVFSA
jgi:hypothetical protein